MRFRLYINSYTDETPYCNIVYGAGDRYYKIKIPKILKPATVRKFNYYKKEVYDDTVQRTYGFFYDTGYLNFYLGRCGGSGDDQRFGYTIPFLDFSFAEMQYLNHDGSIYKCIKEGINQSSDVSFPVPTMHLVVLDFDGEEVVATITREKRIWTRGVNWFKWLKYVSKPLIQENIKIEFDKEVGKNKGSYKGGIIGTGFETQPGETTLAAFVRYAEQHNMVI